MDNSVGFTFLILFVSALVMSSYRRLSRGKINSVIVVCKEDVWIAQKHLKR